MAKTIRDIVEEKGITSLVHFTNAKNLPSILKNGILSVNMLSNQGKDYYFNDSLRLDGHTDAICVSIGFPNYKMFYKIKAENPESEWVVLVLSPKILYELDCAFCFTNAASSECSHLSLSQLKSSAALLRLYKDDDRFLRNMQGIRDCIPTDPQAEVLVFERIDPAYILEINFKDATTLKNYKDCVQSHPHVINDFPFSYRPDHAYWKQSERF